MGRVSVLLFRLTDLRLHDNSVLAKVVAAKHQVLPVLCFDQRAFGTSKYGNRRSGALRARFLLESAQDLRSNLRKLGLDLYVCLGDPSVVVPSIVKASGGPATVFTSLEPCQDETRADAVLKTNLAAVGSTLDLTWQRTMYHQDDLRPNSKPDMMPDSFTPWKQGVEANSKVRAPLAVPKSGQVPALWPKEWFDRLPKNGGFDYLPDLEKDLQLTLPKDEHGGAMADSPAGRFLGGETAALARLQNWMWDQDALRTYFGKRNGLLGQAYR
jgi:deoxyribodipyrimidine photo-lyase